MVLLRMCLSVAVSLTSLCAAISLMTTFVFLIQNKIYDAFISTMWMLLYIVFAMIASEIRDRIIDFIEKDRDGTYHL